MARNGDEGRKGEKKDLLKSTNYRNINTKREEGKKDIEGEVMRKSYPMFVIQHEKLIFLKLRSQFQNTIQRKPIKVHSFIN